MKVLIMVLVLLAAIMSMTMMCTAFEPVEDKNALGYAKRKKDWQSKLIAALGIACVLVLTVIALSVINTYF